MNKRPYAPLEEVKGLLQDLQSGKYSYSDTEKILRECDVPTLNTVMLVMLIGSEYRLIHRRAQVKHPDKVLYDWSKHFGTTLDINRDGELEYFFSKPYHGNIRWALNVFGMNKEQR